MNHIRNCWLSSIGHICYESYPCQHKCSCIYNGHSIIIMVPATTLVDYPELMDDKLLKHFAQYKPSLKYLMKRR